LFFEEGPIFIRIKDILYKYINPLELYGLFNTFKNYDKKLIEEYVSECYPPNTSILLCDKTFLCFISKLYSKKENAIKVAMHLHVFYIDIFKEYLKTFKKIDTKIDLFITTDSEDKKIEIANLLKIFEVDSWVKEIIVYENRGRDVLPWIKISSKMTNYDLVGHFHTKKSKHKKNATVKIWNKEIFSSLLETLPVVLELFANNKKIGILIPDIPINFCSEDKNIGWGDNKKLCISLYERMLTKKRIDLSKVKDPIMPYGNMFWYRPEALQPIFDLNLKDEVFPDEPLPFDGTIAHALERLPVYVAWSEGYDFRISLSEKQIESRFLTKFKKLNSLSITINFDRIFWRIARAIKLPKGLKKVFKKTLFYLLRKN
jgi:rhamnosyltransferase